MPKPKSKKFKVLRIAVVAFVAYTIVSFFVMQIDITNRQKSLDSINEELEQEQYLNKEMQSILDAGTNPEYIKRIAREKLGYVFPDERVFIDPNRKQ